MAQYSKHYKTYLPQEKTNFEVVMIADNYGNVNPGTGGTAADAFGRSRVAEPVTIFDSNHRYADNGQWSTVTATGGTTTHDAYQSTVNLNVTGASGSSVIRETRRVFSYQPGKSLLIYNSFKFNTPKPNLRQRIGFFGAKNGIFLENDGTGNYLVLRRELSAGVIDEVRVAQSDWNFDPFDGTGPSLVDLDVSKANLLWMDIEWLGVGDVRVGFVVNGKILIAHQFNNTNVYESVYMTTATLPLRFEITNTGETGSNSTAKQICSSVMSEGGYEKRVKRAFVSRDVDIAASNTALTPIISFRLKSTNLDSVILPEQFQVFSTATANFEIVIVRGGTLNATTWTTQGRIEYNTDATTISGGTQTSHFYLPSTNQAGGVVSSTDGYNWDTQLCRELDGTSEIVTLAAKSLESSSKNVRGAITYWDLT